MQSCDQGHFQWLYNVTKELAKSHSVTAIMLGYTTAPEGQYPTQLKQAAELLQHLIEKEGRRPRDVRPPLHIQCQTGTDELRFSSAVTLRAATSPCPCCRTSYIRIRRSLQRSLWMSHLLEPSSLVLGSISELLTRRSSPTRVPIL